MKISTKFEATKQNVYPVFELVGWGFVVMEKNLKVVQKTNRGGVQIPDQA